MFISIIGSSSPRRQLLLNVRYQVDRVDARIIVLDHLTRLSVHQELAEVPGYFASSLLGRVVELGLGSQELIQFTRLHAVAQHLVEDREVCAVFGADGRDDLFDFVRLAATKLITREREYLEALGSELLMYLN